MIYTKKIQDAIRFSIKTHEVDQKQKRKGKDIPYITHPLTVGLILSRAGASENVVVAGILHDTIEDSIQEKKVTKEMLTEKFGVKVAELVLSVTEQNKELTWDERKTEALKHIGTFSHESLLLKSADVIANVSELASDHERDGNKVFERFNAPKEKILKANTNVIEAILRKWDGSPLSEDLKEILHNIKEMELDTELKTLTLTGEEFLLIGGIVEPFFKNIPAAKSPQFAIIMGGIGSGKTTLRREKFSDGYVNFDFGEINKAMENSIGEKHPRLMDYSLFACDLVFKECILEKKNIVIEIICVLQLCMVALI